MAGSDVYRTGLLHTFGRTRGDVTGRRQVWQGAGTDSDTKGTGLLHTFGRTRGDVTGRRQVSQRAGGVPGVNVEQVDLLPPQVDKQLSPCRAEGHVGRRQRAVALTVVRLLLGQVTYNGKSIAAQHTTMHLG